MPQKNRSCAPLIAILDKRVNSSGRSEVDDKLWQQTLDEVSAGWLHGPMYEVDEIESLLGEKCVIS